MKFFFVCSQSNHAPLKVRNRHCLINFSSSFQPLKVMGSILVIPAVFGELLWSASILAALGTTLG